MSRWVFRIGKIITWLLIAAYLIAGWNDIVYMDLLGKPDLGAWSMVAGFMLGGAALIWGLSWAIGRIVRWLFIHRPPERRTPPEAFD